MFICVLNYYRVLQDNDRADIQTNLIEIMSTVEGIQAAERNRARIDCNRAHI